MSAEEVKKISAPAEDEVVSDQEAEAVHPSKKKQKTSKDDSIDVSSGPPKRPLSAYILFSNAKREEIKSKGFTGGEIMKEAGRRWNALPEKDKTPYENKAKKLKEEYTVVKAKWDADHISDEEDAPAKRVKGTPTKGKRVGGK